VRKYSNDEPLPIASGIALHRSNSPACISTKDLP
jgi:hypothetical protein